jgi:hypothetical protein
VIEVVRAVIAVVVRGTINLISLMRTDLAGVARISGEMSQPGDRIEFRS